jgi:glycosyltransferase involved in cell wall biosynthesis
VFVWCAEGEIKEWFTNAGAKVFVKPIKFDIDPAYISSLYTFLKSVKIEVIHSHELKAVTNSLIAAFLAGVPVRISHTHTPISLWPINPVIKSATLLGYSIIVNLLATKEIALTESRKKIKEKEGIRSQKLAVIPNALKTQRFDVTLDQKNNFRKEICGKFNIPGDAYIFGNVSRLTEEKGHETLIEAFRKFQEFSIPDKEKVYLLIAGGGRLDDKIKELVQRMGLSDKVFISGVFEAEDIVKYYSSFDSFVFPTLAEGFGLVLIEAMYSELPVICSDLEVLQEVGGSTVLYFETGNSKDLSDKMLNLYQKRGRLNELTQSAKKRVEELFSVQKFGDSYEKLYYENLNARPL